MDTYALEELWTEVGGLFPNYEIDFAMLWDLLLTGDVFGVLQEFISMLKTGITLEAQSVKAAVVTILMVGVVSALVNQLSGVFSGSQTSEMSHFIFYLFLSTVLLKIFADIMELATDALGSILDFMRLVLPTYLLVITGAGGTITAGAYKSICLGLCVLVEYVLLNGVLPAIGAYLILVVLNGIHEGDKFALIIRFVKKGILLTLKASLWVLTGTSILQSMITPTLDAGGKNVLRRVASSLPGVGNVTENVYELMIGSAVIIKNCTSVLFLFLLLLIAAAPLIYMYGMGFLIDVVAAFLGMVGDGRMVKLIHEVAGGIFLLVKCVGCALLLFMVSISILAMTTGRGVV